MNPTVPTTPGFQTAPAPPSDLSSLSNQAYQSAQNANTLTTSAPGLLNELKQNLVGIFAKDNPIMDARNNSLANYLSTANNTRADLLPGNMPMVEGRSLTLSPTQQDAIVTGRNAAALAPLAGYNEILKGMYGNIGDIVKNAGDIYGATITGANTNTSNLEKLYSDALDLYKARISAMNSGGLDLNSILNAIHTSLGTNVPGTGQPSGFFDPNYSVPQNPQNYTYNGMTQDTQPSVFDNIGNTISNGYNGAINGIGNFFENNPWNKFVQSLPGANIHPLAPKK